MNYKQSLVIALIGLMACGEQKPVEQPSNTMFSSLNAEQTGIEFVNQLDYDRNFNIYTYRNFYNGGGVGLGDFNNDGMIDIYLSANMKDNKLYINKGDFQFEDATDAAGVKGEKAWSTGVSVVDINADGNLDIYVCNSGDVEGDNKQNELFINNGDLTFTESAGEYGLDDQGYSTHAAFFDYDKDGDIDVYLLNNSYVAIGSFNLTRNERPNRDPVGGDKLYRNDDGKFTDVSEEAGIYGSIIGFGLGVTVGDINLDGWQDIFISNDFFERDYVYINNGDGTFSEDLENEMRSISAASMGADMADINNDGYPELFVTEMLPEPDQRIKTVTTFEDWDKYQYNIQNGYYHQFTRNMLQLNNGDMSFSEIGRLSDVEATDWSWGALIADYDNDGLKDIFVANGIYKDLTDQDYLQFISNEETMKSIVEGNEVNYQKLIDVIPSVRVPNYCFKNEGDLVFNNVAKDWGLAEPSHSNGSAYGDLDNDGDLDLVVNNVNMPAFVYRNEADEMAGFNYLKIILEGVDKNVNALGAKVRVVAGEDEYYHEQIPVRGFQSSMDNRINVGVGSHQIIDSVFVFWNDKEYSYSLITRIESNQTLTIEQSSTAQEGEPFEAAETQTILKDISEKFPIDYTHEENEFVDFNRHRLIFHMLSTEGPKIAVGDVNNDGREDLYLGGAKGFAGTVFIQSAGGSFSSLQSDLFESDKASEDRNAIFFDADNDGDQDLYVISGGYEFSANSVALQDRLYINEAGKFTKGTVPLAGLHSTSCVRASDFDGDGDQDLFIGSRFVPNLYGVPANSFLLENDGKGNFKNISESVPELQGIGMVTDAVWADIDGDKDDDLIVVGEWMPVKVFRNESGQLKLDDNGIEFSDGWWNSIEAADLDNDGDVDFVLGNHGLNSRFKASPEKPVSMYVNDFDQNGTAEQIITCYNGDSAYSVALKHDLVMQMPGLKKKYLKYENYVEQTISDIFTEQQMEKTIELKAYQMASSILLNEGGQLKLQTLPVSAQLAPVYGILVEDLNGDGNKDILLGGNLYNVKPEVGRYDASYGVFLVGDGKGNFEAVSKKQTGFDLTGEIRDIKKIRSGNRDLLILSRNNDRLQVFEIK